MNYAKEILNKELKQAQEFKEHLTTLESFMSKEAYTEIFGKISDKINDIDYAIQLIEDAGGTD